MGRHVSWKEFYENNICTIFVNMLQSFLVFVGVPVECFTIILVPHKYLPFYSFVREYILDLLLFFSHSHCDSNDSLLLTLVGWCEWQVLLSLKQVVVGDSIVNSCVSSKLTYQLYVPYMGVQISEELVAWHAGGIPLRYKKSSLLFETWNLN